METGRRVLHHCTYGAHIRVLDARPEEAHVEAGLLASLDSLLETAHALVGSPGGDVAGIADDLVVELRARVSIWKRNGVGGGLDDLLP